MWLQGWLVTALIADLSQALSQLLQYLAQVQQTLPAPWPGGEGVLSDAPGLPGVLLAALTETHLSLLLNAQDKCAWGEGPSKVPQLKGLLACPWCQPCPVAGTFQDRSAFSWLGRKGV